MRLLGIDIGGTSIKLCITDEQCNIKTFQEFPSEAKRGGPFLIDKVIRLIKGFEDIDAIGVSTAGQVNRNDGSIRYANENIPNYTGMCVKERIEDVFGVPVLVENDVNAAALGESHFGNGKGFTDFLCLTYGTGIGGAIVMDADIYHGHNGVAAEFGHMLTHPRGILCNCGHHGCYEMYASTTALVRKTQKVDPNYHNGRVIFESLQLDNRLKPILDDWIFEVAVGLTTLIHTFNPPAIIVGGGVMEQQSMINQLRITVQGLVMDSFSDVLIMPAALGNKAGALGAISLHLQEGQKGEFRWQ